MVGRSGPVSVRVLVGVFDPARPGFNRLLYTPILAAGFAHGVRLVKAREESMNEAWWERPVCHI